MYGNKGVFSVMYADMVPLAGIEPASAGYKSAALPLSENGIKEAADAVRQPLNIKLTFERIP